MIRLKSKEEIDILREGGKILGGIVAHLAGKVAPGVSLFSLNEEALRLATLAKARPSFLGFRAKGVRPYPSAICVSIDDEVVHGIGNRNLALKEGSIVSLDMGIEYRGLYTDHAITVPVGQVKKDALKLIEVTRRSLDMGIGAISPGLELSEISRAVERVVEKEGFSVVRELVGHGVGFAVHEEPAVPNFFVRGMYPSVILEPGMVLAIEPMVNMGAWKVVTDLDGWTVRTADGTLSAHFEHTVVITEEGFEVLTEV
ncbi:MAG: methionyl aminopeptidase [Parcubacteria group bacterium Gr01-1014_18]|nr:MAG: methionyl aminopeptidase [Parcubacteria group bacterium Greene0416_36]TSC80273.1 MAG: methionyl aminopeptidase [Parcubacteria group bacterium Gr01-1014_18]TSC98252.1 MAG: methionyl aminopeptidase [Parcubacteria group bacterium Greene1014_20]TSD07005.1 MAG: methionyl aminopeptidase [Parcubacteria group bacterium Greene0714_2]